jgi:hypothetical protein
VTRQNRSAATPDALKRVKLVRLRRRLEFAIEYALDALDLLDGDADFETECEDEGAQCDDEGERYAALSQAG